ncbi:DUF2634 domain-containing protein [Periweissella cryptocerci]|uniref:DUF2634 domain-containing protein n=1 Tax=Periweissella cryptocerci TaxID=2506420 RepID=A0A4P6YWR9_9LACO|nr:DUF2634 domain-containing protein [Periweissella cryptocerci]QBO37288.1 DUF2634 domain-containing protein [Periweissella cryptocerci]
MKDIRIEDGDLVMNSSVDFELVEDNDEVVQAVRNILSIRLGEFVYDNEVGLDYSELNNKNFNLDYLQGDFEDALAKDSRIESIKSIEFDFNPRSRTLFVKLALAGRLNEIDLEMEVGNDTD